MRNGLHLIRRAIADLQRSVSGNPTHRAINYAYAQGMIEIAYAEALITDAEYDGFNRQINQVEKTPLVDTSAWQACNPGCDPEFNGEKSRHCMCEPAKAAMQAMPAAREVASA